MKKYLVAGLLTVSVVALSGCVPPPLTLEYDGKPLRQDVIEEKLEDILEDANPDYDLEVRIIEETEED